VILISKKELADYINRRLSLHNNVGRDFGITVVIKELETIKSDLKSFRKYKIPIRKEKKHEKTNR
jgi:hypothetical protein